MGKAQAVGVILIEDNPFFLRVLLRFLARLDTIRVLGTARNAMEGLECACELHPQVVITDLNMPGLSGLELLPRLKEALPSTEVILLTLYDDESMCAAALKGGADGFVSKSQLADDLEAAVLHAAEHSRRGQNSAPPSRPARAHRVSPFLGASVSGKMRAGGSR